MHEHFWLLSSYANGVIGVGVARGRGVVSPNSEGLEGLVYLPEKVLACETPPPSAG